MSDKTKPHKQRIQIINLLGNPTLTHAQIAEAVGVSTKTVQRAVKDIRPDVEAVEQKLAEYRISIRERLPIEKRADIVAEIAKDGKKNAFAALKAGIEGR